VKKCKEGDGFCRTGKLDYFLARDTLSQEEKSCVRLPRIPDWLSRIANLSVCGYTLKLSCSLTIFHHVLVLLLSYNCD